MASISMPPPPRSAHVLIRDSSSSSVKSEEVHSASSTSPGQTGCDVTDRSRASTNSELESGLLSSTVVGNGHSRPQNPYSPPASHKSNRVSTSSLYSLSSIVHTGISNAGLSSSAASASSIVMSQATGSGDPSSATSLAVFSGQDSAIAASTAKAATSPVSVLTSSSLQHTGSLVNTNHQLEAKDQSTFIPGQSLLNMAHSAQSDQIPTLRPLVTSSRGASLIHNHSDTARSRSRSKQQRSRANTNAGSQSPGSDRGFHLARESRESTGWSS